ncbi:hypothetical protein [Pantoea sp. Fr+CA_20]|uniref:hypothetical protein n=1 Tax=Pantoea TaxID=53335 RepID=UPI0021177FB0|nr:hypothetical protein [Pantoea sp. Fr+CA_20]
MLKQERKLSHEIADGQVLQSGAENPARRYAHEEEAVFYRPGSTAYRICLADQGRLPLI